MGDMTKGTGLKGPDISRTPSLRKTRFTEFFVRENALDDSGFCGWVFYPGMLFNALDRWWGDKGKRGKAHEGLDLCLFRDRRGRIQHLDEKTRIPVLHGGMVVGIINDFLGKSVIIEHAPAADGDDGRSCAIYGHTMPQDDLCVGRVLKEGDIIGTLADTSKTKANICPHLHISLGWTAGTISYVKLDWETMRASHNLTLQDPMHVIDSHYRVLGPDQVAFQ